MKNVLLSLVFVLLAPPTYACGGVPMPRTLKVWSQLSGEWSRVKVERVAATAGGAVVKVQVIVPYSIPARAVAILDSLRGDTRRPMGALEKCVDADSYSAPAIFEVGQGGAAYLDFYLLAEKSAALEIVPDFRVTAEELLHAIE